MGGLAFCRRERKNVNLPGVIVDLPTLTAKDEVDLVQWGIPNEVDFIAASFVRKGSDLDYIHKARAPPACTGRKNYLALGFHNLCCCYHHC